MPGSQAELRYCDCNSWGGFCPGDSQARARDPSAALGGNRYELPSELSQCSPGKDRKCPLPLLQIKGTTPNVSLIKPHWPGPRHPCRRQFRGGRENSSEQGHSRCKIQGRSSFRAPEAPPTGLLGDPPCAASVRLPKASRDSH